MKKRVPKPRKAKVEAVHKATLIVLGKRYTAEGTSASEAISNLQPGNVKGRSILIIEKGEQKKERVLMPIVTMRLFNTRGLTQEVALKNASLLFGL